MFVVLEGTLEVRVGDELIRVFSPGDVFGEMAFLLERPRSADVYAATDGRVLSLSEGTLRKAIGSDPAIARSAAAQPLEDALLPGSAEQLSGAGLSYHTTREIG
jgi:CRP-like cAMP-binding protein